MIWFRFYDEVLDDPKVQRLAPDLFKDWVNLLCLASRQSRRGTLPREADIAFALRKSIDETRVTLQALLHVTLLVTDDVTGYAIYNWQRRQYRSDSSAERVRKHREKNRPKSNNGKEKAERATKRSCNVTRNVPVTDTETETETEEENTPLIDPPLPSGPPKIAAVSILGPEFDEVGRYAEEQGGDCSWALWSGRMGRAGHSARDIRDAIDLAAGTGQLHQGYVAKILRGWAKDGRPPERASRPGQAIPRLSAAPPVVRADPESTHPRHRTEAQHRAVAAKWGVSLDVYFDRIGVPREVTA